MSLLEGKKKSLKICSGQKKNFRTFVRTNLEQEPLIIIFICCILLCCGCGTNLAKGKKEAIEYTICKDSSFPRQLKELVQQKKEKPGTFTYKNSMYTYLVVCYGSQSYSGYSIQVEECYRTEDVLYLETQLMGPSGAEPIVKTETFPYIVIRCERTDLLCIIES